MRYYMLIIMMFILNTFLYDMIYAKTERLKIQSSINSYSVAPTIIELDLNRNRAGFLILTNNTRNTYRVRIACKYFTPDELYIGEHLSKDTAKIEDISKLIIISPRVIKLGPMSRRKIRFSIRLDGKKREPGEYRASFEFRPVIKPVKNDKAVDSKGIKTQISWILELRIPVYITIGERGWSRLEVSGKLTENPERGKRIVRLDVKNPTNWRYPVEFSVIDISKNERIGTYSTVLLRGTKNTIDIPLDRPCDRVKVYWSSYLKNIPAEAGNIIIIK